MPSGCIHACYGDEGWRMKDGWMVRWLDGAAYVSREEKGAGVSTAKQET